MDGQSSTMRHLKVNFVFRPEIAQVLPSESLYLEIVFDCRLLLVVPLFFLFFCFIGNLGKCQELLAMGAKVDIPDNDGFTAAYMAKSRGYKVGMSNFYASRPVIGQLSSIIQTHWSEMSSYSFQYKEIVKLLDDAEDSYMIELEGIFLTPGDLIWINSVH